MVLLPEFKDEIIPFAKLATDLGVDYGVIKHCSDDEFGTLGIDYSKYDFSICIDFADFRITSIESVNASCPVILSNETSLNFIKKYDFLYFCEPNLNSLTKAILNMLDKKTNWSNREMFLNNYLWKNYFNKRSY